MKLNIFITTLIIVAVARLKHIVKNETMNVPAKIKPNVFDIILNITTYPLLTPLAF